MPRLVHRVGAALVWIAAVAACRHRAEVPRDVDASREEADASSKEGGAIQVDSGDGAAAAVVDGGDARAVGREVSPEALAAWCRDATRHRARGPEGALLNAFFHTRTRACRERFAYRVERFLPNKPGDYGYGQFVVAIVHLADDGRTELAHEFRVEVTMAWNNESVDEFEVGDVDGDGTAEVYYGVYTHGEGTFEWERRLLTLHDGKLEPVHLPHDYQANGLTDVDGDGLWDVLTAGPYGAMVHDTVIGGDVPFFGEPGPFLLHSLGGFRFATDDPVTRTNVRLECRRRSARTINVAPYEGPEPNEGAPDWRNPMQIVCARVDGQDASRVRTALRRQCKRFGPPGEGCLEGLLRIADTEPPLQFDVVGP